MPILAAALAAPLLWPLITGRIFTGDDLPNFNLPIRWLYGAALRGGDSILWTSSLFSGLYVFGDGQGGMAHPLHLLLYRLLPIQVAFGLEILTSYLVALAGARALFRRLDFTPAASWLGAIVFAFSGFNLLHLSHMNAVAIVAHVPWVLVATHALMTSGDRRRRAWAAIGLSVLVASELLLGYPHYVWMTVLADAAFALGLIVAGAAWSRIALVVIAAAIGVMIGAVQLLPTWDMLHSSVRADPSLAFRLTGSLSPWNLLQLVSPYVFAHRIYASPDEFLVNEFGIYNGAFCTLSLAWLALRWRSLERRRLAGGLVAFGGLALLLALGRDGGLYPLLAQLPVLNTLRVPARHIVLVHLALAALGAIAFDDLVGLQQRRERLRPASLWPLTVPVAVSVATTIAGIALSGTPWATMRFMMLSGWVKASVGAALMIAAASLFLLCARGVRWALPALAVFVVVDLAAWGYGYVFQTPLRTIDAIAAAANVPSEARPGEYVAPPANLFQANLGVLSGLRLSSGYAGLIPASVLDPNDAIVARLGGVSWRLAGSTWTRVDDPMPRARLVADARVSHDAASDLRAIDMATTALVDVPVAVGPGASIGEARVTADRPGSIVVRTTAPAARLLVLTERFHEGWRASEDGRTCPIARAYGDYLSCVVTAGTHDVTFTFAPASARNGARLGALGFGMMLVMFVIVRRAP
jgi:hypothetical protein